MPPCQTFDKVASRGYPLTRLEERAWLKLGEPRARQVKSSAEEKRSLVYLFFHFIEAVKPLYLVERHGQPRLAAADAFASHRRAGISGWWLPAGVLLCVKAALVLLSDSYQFTIDALPAWFRADVLEQGTNLQ